MTDLVEFDVRTDEMLVNMGPQHPSTHGVLRLVLRTDGEVVREVTPHLGYLHRCAEKTVKQLATGILKHQDGLTTVSLKVQRSRRPRAAQFIPERIFVDEAIECRRGWLLGNRQQEHHAAAPAPWMVAQPPAKGQFTVLPQHLKVTKFIRAEPRNQIHSRPRL